MVRNQDRDKAPFDVGGNRLERESCYWIFLLLFLVCFLAVFDKHVVFAALEDGAMELSRQLFSAYGAGTLLVILVIACRCTSDPYKAIIFGVVVFSMVFILGFLKAYIFPQQFIPFEIDGDWFMGNSNETVSNNSNGAKVVNITKEFEYTLDDLNNVGGFMVIPIACVVFFGSIMMAFKINSGRAFLATFLLCFLGCLIAFKVMVLDQHKEPGSETTLVPTTTLLTTTIADMALTTAVEKTKKKEEKKKATCEDFSCPTGYVVQNAASTTSTLDNCCQATCAAYSCPSGYVVQHAASTKFTLADCCQAHPKKSQSEAFLLGAHEPSRVESVTEMGVEAAYASQLAATRGGRPLLGPVERLQAVEAKLDELLSRTATSQSWISKFGFGSH